MNIFWHLKLFISNKFIFKSIVYCPPSLTRDQPTEILGCSLVRANVKVGHRPERQNARPVDLNMNKFLIVVTKMHHILIS